MKIFYYLDTKMTQNKLSVTWLQSSLYDAARVAGTFVELQQQFFQHHNFTILPYPSPDSIYVPDIDYKIILSFKKAPTYHSEGYVPELLSSIEEQLNRLKVGNASNPQALQHEFTTIQKEFEKSLLELFPFLFAKISSITIITTKFGSEGSFDYKRKSDGYDIFVWIRTTGLSKDLIISHLIHCILSALVLISTKVSDSTTIVWRQREAIVDFLLQHTALQSLCKHVHTLPAIESKQKSQKKLEDSAAYLHKLQCLLDPPRIFKKDATFFVDTTKIDYLTEKEIKLMTILFEHRNTFVNKDTLFDILYGEDGGSDWSLSKLVERLRHKIEKTGITYPLLVTSRGQGYKLLASH